MLNSTLSYSKKILLLGCMLIVMVNSVIAPDTDYLQDLRFYFSYDDADTDGAIVIDANNKDNGTNVLTQTGLTGFENEAYNFTHSNDGFVGDVNFWNVNDGNLTASVWVNMPTQIDGRGEILGWGNPASTISLSAFRVFENKVSFGQYDGSELNIQGTSIVTNQTWVWLGVRKWANDTVTVYVNGFAQNTGQAIKSPASNVLIVGANTYSSPRIVQEFFGLMDELSVWNRTLSENDLLDIYINSLFYDFTTGDTTFPTFSTNSTNQTATFPKIYDILKFNASIADETDLDTYTIEHNMSGTLINLSSVSISGTSFLIDENITVTTIKGDFVIRACFNDTSGNTNCTDQIIVTVKNTLPDITINSPANGDNDNIQLTANFDYTDNDGENGNCKLYINGSVNATNTSVTNGSTGVSLTTIGLTDGNWSWIIGCSDSDGETNSSERFFVFDSTNPSRTAIFPLTDISTNVNITYRSSWTDINLFITNLSVYNPSGTIVGTLTHDDINSTNRSIIFPFNFTSGNGDYVFEDCATDDSTFGQVSKKGKKGESVLLFNSSDDRDRSEVSLIFIEKDDKLTDSPSTLKSWFIDDYEWGINFTVLKPETKIVFNITSNQKIKDRSNANHDGHLVYGARYHGFDSAKTFTVNGETRTATLEVTRLNDYEYQIKWIPDILLVGGDVVFIDPIEDGTNSLCENTTVSFFEQNSVSLNHFDLDISSVQFDSDTFIAIFNQTFNLTEIQGLVVTGSGQVHKASSNTSSTLSMKIEINNFVLFNESLRSLSNLDNGGAFTIPTTFLNSGNISNFDNNVSVFVKNNGVGAINISNLNFKLFSTGTNAGQNTTHKHTITNVQFNSSVYISLVNYTLTKTFNSTTFIDWNHKFSIGGGTGNSTPSCFAQNNVTNEITPTYSRFLSDVNDTGSSGMQFISSVKTKGAERWELFCKSTGSNIINNNISFHHQDLTDQNSGQIGNFQNQTISVLNLTSGTNKILTSTYTILNSSSEIELFYTIIAQSLTGSQEAGNRPTFKINSSTLSSDNCTQSTTTRAFSSDSDIGTIKVYADCNNVSIGQTHVFELWAIVESGENLSILNASMSGIESNSLTTIFSRNLAPIVAITNPVNGTSVSGNIFINWTTTDLNGDNFQTNVTLTDSAGTTVIESNLGISISNITFDTTSVSDGIYDLTILSFENDTTELLSGFQTHILIIDNGNPIITITKSRDIVETDESIIITIKFSDSDSINVSTWNVNYPSGDTIISGTGNTSFLLLNELVEEGLYTINAFANDSLGNTARKTSTFVFEEIVTSSTVVISTGGVVEGVEPSIEDISPEILATKEFDDINVITNSIWLVNTNNTMEIRFFKNKTLISPTDDIRLDFDRDNLILQSLNEKDKVFTAIFNVPESAKVKKYNIIISSNGLSKTETISVKSNTIINRITSAATAIPDRYEKPFADWTVTDKILGVLTIIFTIVLLSFVTMFIISADFKKLRKKKKEEKGVFD